MHDEPKSAYLYFEMLKCRIEFHIIGRLTTLHLLLPSGLDAKIIS